MYAKDEQVWFFRYMKKRKGFYKLFLNETVPVDKSDGGRVNGWRLKWSFDFDNIKEKFHDSYQTNRSTSEKILQFIFDMQINWKVEGESMVKREDLLKE